MMTVSFWRKVKAPLVKKKTSSLGTVWMLCLLGKKMKGLQQQGKKLKG